jgi:hypothetical protein
MGIILIILLLIVLFGGGFGYRRGYYGGGGLGFTGVIVIILIVVLLAGCAEFRSIERKACVLDQAGQIAIVSIEGVASALEPVAALPIAVAHKATQLGCAVVLARKPGG